MAQVAVMSPDGSVKKIDRDSQEGLEALRKLSALMLKAALKQEFKGIRLGEAVADEDGFHVDSDKDNQQVSTMSLIDKTEEIIELLVQEIAKLPEGTESTIAREVSKLGIDVTDKELFDIDYKTIEKLDEKRILLDKSKYVGQCIGLSFNIPFVVRKLWRSS